MSKMTLKDLDVRGKKVLVRVDFNVPMTKGEKREIQDDTRIRAALPTICYLLDHEATVILMSHLGRPEGKASPEFSLAPVARRLSKILDKPVHFIASDQVVDQDVQLRVKALQKGDLALLENTRFSPGEPKNDPAFAKSLASLGDVFVNDAFGTCHRTHASNVGLASLLPSALGFLVEEELTTMGEALREPRRPFTAIIGGAKVSDKIGIIDHLIDRVDNILIGGGMSYTFLKAQGIEIGTSLLDEEKIDLARALIQKAKEKKVRLLLPIDGVIAEQKALHQKTEVLPIEKIPKDKMSLDIGPKTAKLYAEVIESSATVVWNGPMGVFEIPEFSKGTKTVAQAMANCLGVTIVGGGDSAAAIQELGLTNAITHVSTGGGASLKFLEGKALPGVACISDKSTGK